MKYLLIFFIFMVLLYQWRNSRKPKVRQAQRKSTTASGPVAMVACAHCGMHLPGSEAVQGKQGMYCSGAHRLAQEP